ncbi:serine threonine protein kinase [Musa troglodytarum]|uniref:Serine threonine protein kinase n=1 Tax=Musa troglodytarum TaxID=320322 RepID=A0A9E7EFU8_9LILI|nr:serine threonine protein kinase [Musa troglodytarum]
MDVAAQLKRGSFRWVLRTSGRFGFRRNFSFDPQVANQSSLDPNHGSRSVPREELTVPVNLDSAMQLTFLACHVDEKRVEALLKDGVDVSSIVLDGRAVLHIAACEGHVDALNLCFVGKPMLMPEIGGVARQKSHLSAARRRFTRGNGRRIEDGSLITVVDKHGSNKKFTVGRAGIAPFFVVQIAPQAFANNKEKRKKNREYQKKKRRTLKRALSLAIETRRAPTNASPAPVVSMVFTAYPGSCPLKS